MKVTPEKAAAFLSRVDVCGPDECWHFKRKNGELYQSIYPLFRIDGKQYGAHRVSYAIANGGYIEDNPPELPKALWNVVMHGCDNPPCCNPKHLTLGTHQENTRQNMAHSIIMNDPNYTSRMTNEAIHEIRREAVTWNGMCDMMKKYVVCEITVRRIVKRLSWKHVPEE
jgi:hypothetical protein